MLSFLARANQRQLGTSEAAFLEMFLRFCEEKLPRNARLRADMITSLQTSSARSSALMPFGWYRPDVLVPTLPDPWQQKACKALKGGRVANITIRNVSEPSLQLLRPGRMINDEIVEGYLELVRKTGATVSTTRVLQTWSAKHPIDRAINAATLEHSGSVLLPIHNEAMSHWTFARVLLSGDGHTVVAEHFDSLRGLRSPAMLEKWLRDTFQGIDVKIIPRMSPEQKNGVDCGLYMLMGIRLVATGSQHLTAADAESLMPTFRQRVLAEILAGTLDPDLSTYAPFIMADEAAAQEIQAPAAPALYSGTGVSNPPFVLDSPSSSPTIEEKAISKSVSPAKIDTKRPVASTRAREHNKRAPPTSRPLPLSKEPASSGAAVARKEKANTLLRDIITSFAEKREVFRLLKGALSAYRKKAAAVSSSETLAELWSVVAGQGHAQHTMITRHCREQFSRTFYKELKKLGWSGGRVARRIRVRMEIQLKCLGDQGTWKAALAQASTSNLWVQLVDRAAPLLAQPSHVVLCAIPYSTTAVENPNFEERKAILEVIERRLRDAQDSSLVTLEMPAHCTAPW